jgi:bifunctional DNA primase/polymerase-like protein
MLDRFVRLTDNGWHPIPVLGGKKQPDFRGWTKHCREPMTTTRYRQLVARGKGGSLGIACGLVIAVDIDVTDETLAKSVQELAQLMLGVTGLIRIGKSPKRIMVYRTAEPVNLPPFIGANSHRVEFLVDRRQFVAFGKHPETGQDYRWIGDVINDAHATLAAKLEKLAGNATANAAILAQPSPEPSNVQIISPVLPAPEKPPHRAW